jgi:SAM-dependent methyltransferase
MNMIKKVILFVIRRLRRLKKQFHLWVQQQIYLLKKQPYSLENARNYWRYPPSKAYGKRDTAEYRSQSDSFIKDLIERETKNRDARQETKKFKDKVAYWVQQNGIQTMMDFGCGLGQDGLYFAKSLGLGVIFADIVPSNVELTSRFAGIWDVPTESVLVEDPTSFNFGKTFDLIFANGVLHHSPEAKEIVRNLKRFLHSEGIFIVMLYTKKHYERARAKNMDDYALKSEASAPLSLFNPYTEYYDLEKTLKLFEGCTLMDQWTTYNDLFGWYCFKNTPEN